MNKHTVRVIVYVVGALCSASLVCLSAYALVSGESVLYNLWGLCFGVGLAIANTRWAAVERRAAEAAQAQKGGKP